MMNKWWVVVIAGDEFAVVIEFSGTSDSVRKRWCGGLLALKF